MSTRDAIADRAKKATDASREQLHAYIGRNDYWYEQLRGRRPAVVGIQELPDKLRSLTKNRTDIATLFEPYKPAQLRQTLQTRIEASRQRRKDLAGRGEIILRDWQASTAVKDVEALVKTVRSADGTADLAKSLRGWAGGFTPTTQAKAALSSAPKPKPTKATARKSATSPARKTATAGSPARKSATSPARKRPAAKASS